MELDEQVTRINERLDILGSISEYDSCLSRSIGTEAHEIARNELKTWMESAGMVVSVDDVGNVRGVLKSAAPDAKHFVIGSHYDTVFDAGKYDGPLGIMLGIEVADLLNRQQSDLPFHLNVVAFSDEEGSRFNTTYFGSSALIGKFNKEWLKIEDKNGKTVHEVLEQSGFEVSNINRKAIEAKDWLGYFEPHIEQGPVLCEENLSVCLVSGIAAQTRVNVEWTGVSGHAGTCPMNLRNDALCAASEMVIKIEELGKKHNEKLVATVGSLIVKPNSSNVIPGTVSHTIDLRSLDNEFLETATSKIHDLTKEISSRRQVQCEWKVMQSSKAVSCDESLNKVLGECIKSKSGRLLCIPSGAGHDAAMISKAAPVTMMFVRCKEGISHNPAEYTFSEDIKAALDVSHLFIQTLIESNTPEN